MGDQPAFASTPLDAEWLRDHPLPVPAEDSDKNERGRVLVLGGSLQVPGGIRLTAEAALRAGAGKVRIGTVASAAVQIGVLFPEAAILPLLESAVGEIDVDASELREHLGRSDAVVVGPAMACGEHASRLLGAVFDGMAVDAADGGQASSAMVIDASALMSLGRHTSRLRARTAPAVITPHIGEMAALLEREVDEIDRDRIGAARDAARKFRAVVVLKGATTLIAETDGRCFVYKGGNVGLATGGSGDVLAGIAGALLARGCCPLDAALWAVWLHGEAGRHCAEAIGSLGYLARELIPFLPRLMQTAAET